MENVNLMLLEDSMCVLHLEKFYSIRVTKGTEHGHKLDLLCDYIEVHAYDDIVLASQKRSLWENCYRPSGLGRNLKIDFHSTVLDD